ncbi:MAG: tetratricopeptide repeat protein [Phycisphaerae bacterium]|jgi:tetratricopeptide (TPR) repeat protein
MKPLEQYRAGIAAFTAGEYAKAIGLLAPLTAEGGRRGRDLRPPGGQGMPARYYLAQAHYRLAVRLFESRRLQEATKHFLAAAQINPAGGDYGRYLADCYTQAGQFDLAARELSARLDREPDDAEARIRYALTLWKQGNAVEALAALREGVRRQPLHAELHYQLGVMLAAENDLAEAQRLFERAIALEPAHAKAHERLAQCCALMSRHERALAYLQRAHQLDAANHRIAMQLNLLAQSLIAQGQEVRIDWQPARSGRPDARAIERLGEVIIKEPEFVEAFLSLPETEVDAEVFSTLAAILEQALHKHPEYADLHYHCGAVYRRLGQDQAALRHAERAVEINDRYVNALILLAGLYARNQRWQEGVERLEQAIRAGGDYPDVHCLLGRLFQSGGDVGRARRAFERALQLKQDYSEAREALAALA